MWTFHELTTRKDDRPIFLFGAGTMFSLLYGELVAAGIVGITDILDNSPNKWGALEGLPVHSPATPGITERNPLVILTSINPLFLAEMGAQCRDLGLECIAYPELVANSFPEPEQDFWADAESARVFKSLVSVFKTRDMNLLPPVTPEPYFQPFIPGRMYRDFVDGGAYVGDTLAAYSRHFDSFDSYYAFEPDHASFGKLEAYARGTNAKLFNLALSDREIAGGDSIDSILAGQKVGCIKLDVEGAEPKVLNGARNTIARHKPALAVCVYHSPMHLWSIPNLIRQIEPRYRLYLRHHSPHHCETVCYAVI